MEWLSWRVVDIRLKLLQRGVNSLARLENKSPSQEEQAKVLAAEVGAQDTELKLIHEKALYTSIGFALTTWARMEDSLIAMTGMLLGTKFTYAGVVMYSIVNFNIWLVIIDELFSLNPTYKPLKPKWNKINERLKALKDTRDRLAHHVAQSADQVAFGTDTSLRPARFDTRAKAKKYQPLTFNQISSFIESVAAVVANQTVLINAMTEILEREPSPQKSSEQDSGQNPP